MYFLLYNVESSHDGMFYLFGRELLLTGEPDLRTVHMEKSRIRRLSVHMKSSSIPYLFVFDEFATTDDQLEAIEDIKKKLRPIRDEEESIEIVKYKNIFYDDLDENITVIRMIARVDNHHIRTFKHIKKVIKQFTNYDEYFLISKNIRGPCLLKIDITEDFILYNQFKSINLNSPNAIIVLGKVDLPKINCASLAFKYHNKNIEGYSLCINGHKMICGLTDTSLELKTIKNGKNIFKTYSNAQKMIADIQSYLDIEQIDNLVVYNIPHGILKQFDFLRFLFCDLYVYSLGTIKCRDYSLMDLCEYYNCKFKSHSFSFYLGDEFANLLTESKAIYDVYIASDALLLSKEMSEISGYTINKALSNNRAKIIDFALLHELYGRNYLFPYREKHVTQQYTGGMVLAPAVGAYTDAVLLLDFNSLYPSIIQEFNVCFSTIGNPKIQTQAIDDDTIPLPETSSVCSEKGFLPVIIANLVNRRREVKKLIGKNNNGDNKIYDLRQKALKLLANSIYGCLGFVASRFCNYKMASFITQKGRELLEESMNIVINDLGLEVIYGDTDSIMINTKLSYCDENLEKIQKISEDIKNRINSRYKHIELDLDRIFVRLFLYKKKKYTGLYVAGNGILKKEYKGIDTVRRDICKATIDILNNVLDILLDDTKPLDYSEARKEICILLHKEAGKLKSRPISDFIINIALSKSVELYHKNVTLPHISLARQLMERGINIDQRAMISFVICDTGKNEPVHKRAFLPSEVKDIDFDYYVTNQIVPSLLKIVRILNCIDINDLQRIFGCKVSIPNSQNISTHFVKFMTDCCNKLQDPSDVCMTCNKAICEEFYFNKVKEIVNNEITNLYKLTPMCTECGQDFDRFSKNCKFCSSPLIYKPENEEFSMFIDNLAQSFSKTKFEQVKRFISMHIEHSSFKIFDLRLFFSEEIHNHERNVNARRQ